METSVLLYDPALKKHVLQLKEGPYAGKPWFVDLRVCDNPLCRCSSVDFLCVPSEASSSPRSASVGFALDVVNRRVNRADDIRPAAASDALANAVASQLGEPGWDYLYRHLLGVKQEQIDECDVRRLDADFPPEVLRGDVSVVGYGEIFYFAPGFHFEIESQEWLAVDDYCVNPECECREVVLQFVRSKGVSYGPSQDRETIPAVYYNYRERMFREANAPAADCPLLNDLVGAMRAHWPGFESKVKERHRRLKVLFKRALRKGVPSAAGEDVGEEPRPAPRATSSARVGRNDPCPCGSGRKYKKCCGR
jgi:hypothetical protein